MALLTITEASRETGLPPSRLRALCRDRRIAHKNLGTKGRPTYMLELRHVEAWLAKRTVAEVQPVTAATPDRTRRNRKALTVAEITAASRERRRQQQSARP